METSGSVVEKSGTSVHLTGRRTEVPFAVAPHRRTDGFPEANYIES